MPDLLNLPDRKLGMQPKAHDENAFRFRAFVNVDKAKVPTSHVRHLATGEEWQMLGNDRYGDCADVARAHGIKIYSHVQRRKPFSISDDQVVQDYLGYAPQDDGTDPDAMMAMWRKTPVWGTEPILAYLSVSMHTAVLDIPRVDYLFGTCYLAFAMPAAVEPEWGSWPVPPPEWKTDPRWSPYSWGGHMVMTHGFSRKGVKIVTWGKGDWFVPWEFCRAYLVGAWAVVHPMWLSTKAKRTSTGLDEAALGRELAGL